MTTEPKISWTEQQEQAILARGRNVLVTASAGTGKTAVLSERCVGIVSDAALCPSVLNMLVVAMSVLVCCGWHWRHKKASCTLRRLLFVDPCW